MKTLLSFLFVGAVVVSQTDACAQCPNKHPQQHYCMADFAVKVKVKTIQTIDEFTGSSSRLIRARVLDGMTLGSRKTGKKIEFTAPSSFCGTTFVSGREYVITGSVQTGNDRSKQFFHGSCDFASEWADLSPQQQKGFTGKYGRFCDCKVKESWSPTNIKVEDFSFENTYPDARTYWTPTMCYYNPHKSEQTRDIEDCESEYGYCAQGSSGECSWQLTPDYEECFRERDDYVIADSGEFAITDPEQCQVLPRRKRKECRRLAREYAESLAEEEIELPF